MSGGPVDLTFTDRERRALRYCTYCPRMCRFACPVAHGESRETVTPWGLMRLVNALDQGFVAPEPDLHEVLHHCISCGRCQSYCVHDNPVAEVLGSARAQLLAAGQSVPERFEVPQGGCATAVERPAFREGRAELPVFLPSCAHLRSTESSASLLAGLEALERAGLRLSMPGGKAPLGCGFHEWEVGDVDRATESWARFEAPGRGRPACVTDCAPPLWTFQREAPAQTAATQHLAEWLAENVERLPGGDGTERVAIHDACFEVRRLGLGEAVRAVVERLVGGPARDLYESGDQARCCGAAGRWADSFGEEQGRAAATVVDDVADAGVDLVVTPNPSCRASLAGAVTQRGLTGPSGQAVAVVDLLGLLTR